MSGSNSSDPRILTVTGIYDTPQAGRRIQTTVDHLDAQLGGEVGFDLRLWRADMLDLPAAYADAHQDAAASDLLTVAFAGDGRIQGGLEALVEEWTSEHHRPAALAVLLEKRDINMLVLGTFRRMASEHEVDFICSEDEDLSGWQLPGTVLPSSPRLPNRDPWPDDFPSARFFGLNE